MIRRLSVLSLAAVMLGGCATSQPRHIYCTRLVDAPEYHPPRSTQMTPRPPRPAAPQPAPTPVPGRAQWRPACGRISPCWTTIVIHHSATSKGGASSFDSQHRRKGWDELGYHFVIGNGTDTPDGSIEVGSRWHKQKHGAHCKTPSNYYNEHGIGICLVGDFTESQPSQRQLASLTRLLDYLCAECRIPAYRITCHRDVTRRTQCPGNFPLASVRRSVHANVHATSVPTP